MHGASAEGVREGQPIGDRVHRDHPLCPRRQCHLDGAEADGPQPEHGDDVAAANPGGVNGVVASPHHVPREQGDVVREPRGHLAQGELGGRHQQQLGLRALREQLAVSEYASVVALVEVPAPAEEALAARGAIAAEHAVTLREPPDLIPYRDDRAHELVPDREAGIDLDPPVVDVEV